MDASPLPDAHPPAHQPAHAPSFGPSCPGCGRPRTEDDARGVAWSSHRTADGAVDYLCPDCTRDEVRQIEAGLPVGTTRRSPAA